MFALLSLTLIRILFIRICEREVPPRGRYRLMTVPTVFLVIT